MKINFRLKDLSLRAILSFSLKAQRRTRKKGNLIHLHSYYRLISHFLRTLVFCTVSRNS